MITESVMFDVSTNRREAMFWIVWINYSMYDVMLMRKVINLKFVSEPERRHFVSAGLSAFILMPMRNRSYEIGQG
jgi:uncharacterized protein (UPF0305 family)